MSDEVYEDHVMEALRFQTCQFNPSKSRQELPNLPKMWAIYQTTPKGSLLRKLVTGLCAWAGAGKYFAHHDPRLVHPEFMTDLIAKLDDCIRQPQAYEILQNSFRRGYPWPYFHKIEGTTEQLMPQEGNAAKPIQSE